MITGIDYKKMKIRSENEMIMLCTIAVLIVVMAVFLSGCTTTKTVYVPTGCPKVTIPLEPHYPAQDLKRGDPTDKVHKAAWATIGMQHDFIHEIFRALSYISPTAVIIDHFTKTSH